MSRTVGTEEGVVAFKYAGKEHRKPYRRSKAFDATCRNHGSCPWCRENRLHATRKRKLAVGAR